MAYGGKLTGYRFAGLTVLPSRQVLVPAITDPEDPDDDTAYTVRVDCKDGATIRPGRPIFSYAMDSIRPQDLINPMRLLPDRHRVHYDRHRAGKNNGNALAFMLEDLQVGSAGGLKAIVLDVLTFGSMARMPANEDLDSTDCKDGASCRVGTDLLYHSAQSMLPEDLNLCGSVSGRVWGTYPIHRQNRVGVRHAFMLEDLDVGSTGGLKQLVVESTVEQREGPRVPARVT